MFGNLKEAKVREKGGKVRTMDLTEDNLSEIAGKVKENLLKKCNIRTILKEDAAGKYRIEY